MQHIVRVQDGSYEVTCVHYFTSPAKEAFASHGKASVIAQQSYHRAMSAKYQEPMFRMTLGNHSFDRGGSLLPRFVTGQRCDRNDRVRVWSLEEKQTDVNLALAMYRACCKGEADQVVVCSNDSDIEPALMAIREDFPDVAIGIITPIPEASRHRSISTSLARHASWVRRYIADDELTASQLPTRVPTRKAPVQKPEHW